MSEIDSKPVFLTPNKVQPEYPLFVFLPGMDGTGRLLRSQTEGLEVAFDVRCLSIPLNDLTSWADLTQQVVDLIELEIEKTPQRQVYLCGESFGGCLAIKVALYSPRLFDKIILVNPASSFHRRSWYDWVSQLIHVVPRWLYPFGALGLLAFIASLDKMAPTDRKDLLHVMRSVPPETVLWRLCLVREFDVSDAQLRELTQPVLVVASARDRLLPSVSEARHLVRVLENAKMVTLPYSGHACLVEEDTNLYEIMQAEDFLDNVTKTELPYVVDY
ncbi:alpha/beta fold hydrolase [Gloeocapsopsis dulcis]|uniref:Alpha/beta hydrolase n=1 Tax=Gloeocapsopsis dulcis AAB1 = 1H9 TaxID=1433147 RepID=A0A6N8FVF9_9CHRO|nr:alpha/beta hydrolase [Gloeocapsopsis dulcis]MUL36754.1 alpha/beta hydrolase [Gloeocapsopsis dulcis AAB1 = 1H9]WNN91326.1 alpha/beta hydrolase [Gloeocapsopsis dulcis]